MPGTQTSDRLVKDLAQNRKMLVQALGGLKDVVYRELLLPEPGGSHRQALLILLPSMIDHERVDQMLMKPLLIQGMKLFSTDEITNCRLPTQSVRGARHIGYVAKHVLAGQIALIIDQKTEAILVEMRQLPTRALGEPTVETSVHGGREAFGELLDVNLGLIHRRLITQKLRIDHWVKGSLTHTSVAMLYIDGLAPTDLVQGVHRRIERYQPESLLDVEELTGVITDQANTLIPTARMTERPDTVIRTLLSGHVAVLVNSSPRAVVLPGTFLNHMAAMDDYYGFPLYVYVVRLLRFVALAMALYLPGLYVSIISFHQEAIPTSLTLSLMAQREGAPLPTAVEAYLMGAVFEILREAGLRLPKAVGPSISIVGGLVIGEAAMQAGLASPAMVLVVTATAIATFAIPSHTMANSTTFLRLILTFLGSVLGFFGLLIGHIGLMAYFTGLTSGGRPFFAPLMPIQPPDLVQVLAMTPRPPQGPGAGLSPDLSRSASAWRRRPRRGKGQ